MTDIGSLATRSGAFERALLGGWSTTSVLTATPAGSAIPIPGNDVGRRIRRWWTGVAHAIRVAARPPARRHESARPHYHPGREAYVEDARMGREMLRL